MCKELFVKRGKRGFFSGALLGFDNALFFLGLLPPVIFYSGYELHPQWLFGLFYQIVGFAVVGTFVSAVIVGIVLKIASVCHLAPLDITFAETLTFGALVSATDPVSVIAVFTELRVDPKMFYLVFGESVLNDAVGIVLFKTSRSSSGIPSRPRTWRWLWLILLSSFLVQRSWVVFARRSRR